MEPPPRGFFFCAYNARKHVRTRPNDHRRGNDHRKTKHARTRVFSQAGQKIRQPRPAPHRQQIRNRTPSRVKSAKDPTRRPASQDPEPIKRAATCTQCNSRSELLCNDKILMFLLDNSKIYMLWSDCQTGNTAEKGNRGKDRKFD